MPFFDGPNSSSNSPPWLRGFIDAVTLALGVTGLVAATSAGFMAVASGMPLV